ncbi:MAG: O-antigen ligase family protein [Lutibacter sp.]
MYQSLEKIELKKKKLLQTVMQVMIMFSFITYVWDINSSNIFLKRATISVAIGFLIILIYLISNFKNIKNHFLYLINNNQSLIIMIVLLFVTVIFSDNKYKSFLEYLILVYLVLIFYLFVLTFSDSILKKWFPILILTALVTSLVGLYDLIAKNINIPTLFNSPNNYAQSGFRYFGQAGHFIFMFLTILIPLQFSNLNKYLSKFYKNLLVVVNFFSIVFLITTGKLSAIIGLFSGIVLFAIFNFKAVYKTFTLYFVLLIISYFVFNKVVPKMVNRVENRVQSRITNRVKGTPESDFIVSNFKSSIRAFEENPIFGTGLGAYQNVYASTEVHGTILKLLGETGLTGTIGYIIFIISILIILIKEKKYILNHYSNYIKLYIPFFIGSLVCWIYTYHLRKFEFWIVYATIIMMYTRMMNQSKIEEFEKKIN